MRTRPAGVVGVGNIRHGGLRHTGRAGPAGSLLRFFEDSRDEKRDRNMRYRAPARVAGDRTAGSLPARVQRTGLCISSRRDRRIDFCIVVHDGRSNGQ